MFTNKEGNGEMNTIEAIMNRRSYRGRFSDDMVPKKDLEIILKAGLAAPSGCNKQTTSLIAIDDQEILDRIKASIDPIVGETAKAAICVLSKKIYAYRDKCYNVQDYSAAIENMLLAIVELGYQSCWYEGHITDTDRICDKIAKILHVPDEYELVCYMPIGIAIDKIVNPAKKPDEERYWFNTYGGYHFWGWEGANAKPLTNEYPGIDDPIDLYNALSHIWCAETCAPRMRDKWTKDNMTMGQCSITAFLAQDIFGGEVYGIPRSDGNFHCYNVIGDCRFDLTSEQFGDEALDYNDNPKQVREVHFAKEEKRLRYEYLRAALKKYLS